MLNRTLTATAHDHTTQTGGLHEKFMCAAFEARMQYMSRECRAKKNLSGGL